jgi:uncharacterized protein YecE (DUF72 family)
MRFFVGTSGYSYPKWKGTFYPAKLPQKEMLSYYAQRFGAVEINNTFYRMPKASDLESWAAQAPKGFKFALKGPQLITHRKRLKNAAEETEGFLRAAAALRGRLGPLLFQLPPNMKKDLSRLTDFLALLGKGLRAACEFRHESWFDDEVFECLRKNSCALCVADAVDLPQTQLVRTADWGYLRLRRDGYDSRQLGQWIKKIKSQTWSEAYVFFKHEDTGMGPKLAATFLKLAGSP